MKKPFRQITILFIILVIVFYNKYCVGQGSNKEKTNKKPYDTISIENCYYRFNKYPITSFQLITPKIIKTDTAISEFWESEMITIQFLDSIELFYTYNKNPYVGPTGISDREYLTIDHSKIFIDLLFYNTKYESASYESFGEFHVYYFSFNKNSYLAVFSENSFIQMAHGYSLMLFSIQKKQHQVEFIMYKGDQLSSDMRCFGFSEDSTQLFYYDWQLSLGECNDYIEKYPIKTNSVEFSDQLEIDIQYFDRFGVLYRD